MNIFADRPRLYRQTIRAALVVALFLSTTIASALELPVKTVNGQKCYYYTVHRLDNIYAVSDLLGISRQDILKYNPSATDGLNEGMVLYFPVDKFKNISPSGVTDETGNDNSKRVEQNIPGTKRYVVERDETLFGVCHKFNVSPEDIIALNPTAETGVKAGDVLLVPISAEGVANAKKAAGNVQVNIPEFQPDSSNELTPVNPPVIKISDVTEEEAIKSEKDLDSEIESDKKESGSSSAAGDLNPVNENSAREADVEPGNAATVQAKEYNIAIMLPFMLGDEKLSRHASNATDFYKGFLIAADTISVNAAKFNIHAYDTRNSLIRVRELLANESGLADANVIIAPDNMEQLDDVGEFGKSKGIYVVNVANARDSLYITNPYMMQTLVPSSTMLSKAAEGFLAELAGKTLVVLRNDNGRDDKTAFVDDLTLRCIQNGTAVMDIRYDGALSVSDLEDQLGLPDVSTKYVFIPTSGTLNEFNKFSTAVIKYRDKAVEAGGEASVLGYPEWSAFRGETLKSLHDLDATIYTRSFYDRDSREVRGINDSFVKWYGRQMADGIPSQGLLGYDMGSFIIRALASGCFSGGGDDSLMKWDGVQSDFYFSRVPGVKGLVNQSVFIVRFMPGEVIETKVL